MNYTERDVSRLKKCIFKKTKTKAVMGTSLLQLDARAAPHALLR